jgi:hypothetical protein
LDNSGSIYDNQEISKATEEILKHLKQKQIHFNIGYFGTDPHFAFETPQISNANNLEAAKSFFSEMTNSGGTQLKKAIYQAIENNQSVDILLLTVITSFEMIILGW